MAAHVDQRAPGVARIDRRVGLDEEAVVGDPHLGAGERGHDALGDRLANAERIADGKHKVTDFQFVGIGERHRRKLLAFGLQPQNRQIRPFVLEHQLRVELPPIRQRDADLVGIPDHVVVGDHHPVAGDDHARPERLLHPVRSGISALVTEEVTEERVIEQRRSRRRADPA